jgi:hypothetical protein
MKYAFLALAFAFFALGNSLFGQFEIWYFPKNIKGGFKECTFFINKYQYYSLNDSIQKIPLSKYYYNDNGKIILEFGIIDDIMFNPHFYYYDNNDSLTDIIYFNYYNVIERMDKYYYDFKSDCPTFESYYCDELIQSNYSIYDKYNNCLESMAIDDEGELWIRGDKFIYNHLNQLIQINKINVYNKLLNKTIFKHKNNRLVKKIEKDFYIKKTKILDYIYNKESNLEMIIISNNFENYKRKIIYKYDKFNNIIKISYYNKNKYPDEETEFIYSK